MTASPQPEAAVFHYAAYNLGIRSEIPLPELAPAGAGNDFEIRLVQPDGLIEERRIEWSDGPPCEARFSYPGVARFIVREGQEIGIAPDPRGDPAIYRLYVQGMMLAAALYQRGYFVLHASVVDLRGRAIAFMGHVGAGKSTFASAFRARGFKILADDNAAIQLEGPPPLVMPAFPSLKVYPEVARSLGFEPSLLQPMHRSQIKEAQSVRDAFSSAPLPLDAIYLLDREADEGSPQRISAVEVMTELIRHSVPTRWSVHGSARHLRFCALLAKMTPVFRVRTFQRLEEIQPIAGRIEKHAAG